MRMHGRSTKKTSGLKCSTRLRHNHNFNFFTNFDIVLQIETEFIVVDKILQNFSTLPPLRVLLCK